MLPTINLDNQTFEDILQQARNMIPTLTDEWTDFNMHDPGMMLLELFSWLKETQQYYLNAIGDIHIEKYLKLLGSEPKKAVPAAAFVTFENVTEEKILPAGLKLGAKNVTFETIRTEILIDNKIKKVVATCGTIKNDITDIAVHFDNSSDFLFTANRGENSLYIAFEKPLPQKKNISLYFQILNDNRRNPIIDKAIVLADLEWQYFDGDSWKDIEIINDNTICFIQNGSIDINLSSQMVKKSILDINDELYWIRCNIKKNFYEIMPKLQTVAINTFKVLQYDKSSVSFEKEVINKSVDFTEFLAYQELIEVYKKCEFGYILLKKDEDYFIEFNKNTFETKIKFIDAIESLEIVKIICYDRKLMDFREISCFNGCDNQEIEIEQNNIYYTAFEAMKCNKSNVFTALYKGNEFKDESYELNIFENKLKFILENNSAILTKNEKFIISDFSQTLGIDGNVNSFEISEILVPNEIDNFKGLVLKNYHHAFGGSRNQTIFEAIEELRATFLNSTAAVTKRDYENFVKEMPSLAISKVLAVNSSEFLINNSDKNKVCIIVKPYSDEKYPVLSQIYKDFILENLEDKRLLTTDIEIISPHYVPIDINGYIHIKSTDPNIKNQIYKVVYNFLDAIGTQRMFGQEISYGELFGVIQEIPSVEYIESLNIEVQDKLATKKMSGNIEFAPNVLTYLRNFNIELKQIL